MKNLSLNTDNRTFAIKLKWRTSDSLFICQETGLIEAIKRDDQDRKGIEYIKEFDYVSCSFKKVSKESILRYFMETESYLYLQNHYYFKK